MDKIFVSIIYIKKLEEIIDDVTDGVSVRSRCQWYKEVEKWNKFSLNLEKQRGLLKQKKVIVDDKDLILK